MSRFTADERERRTGMCSVCSVRKALTSSGNVKQHKRHDVPCPGSLIPPRAPKPRQAASGWGAQRTSTFSRDGHRCRKCGSSSDLEAHHIKERVYGGADVLDNLITLCSRCHDEWTYAEPPAEVASFDIWLTLPPARYLVALWLQPWPANKSAEDFKREIGDAMALWKAAGGT
jgi:5-methylcytosine-specific restriction endonuclease McrA